MTLQRQRADAPCQKLATNKQSARDVKVAVDMSHEDNGQACPTFSVNRATCDGKSYAPATRAAAHIGRARCSLARALTHAGSWLPSEELPRPTRDQDKPYSSVAQCSS
jgi:hypothetical protein